MKRNWQQCSPTQRLGRWRVPQATMNRRGDLKLSRVAWEMLDLAPYAFVLFDKANQTIGIRPCGGRLKDTFPLNADGNHGAAVLNLAALRYDFGIKFEKTIRFHDIHTDHEGTLILDLTKATPAYHGHRIGAFHNERKEKQGRKRDVVPYYIRDL
jgi:hypothetical protein